METNIRLTPDVVTLKVHFGVHSFVGSFAVREVEAAPARQRRWVNLLFCDV